MQPRIIFITGTDTGVGKTLLTALLLSHLRQTGCLALALKPFCSGSRADAELLHTLQGGDLLLDQINPFYFSEPVAPLVAARFHSRSIKLEDVLKHIRSLVAGKLSTKNSNLKTPPCLLIEGAGGLLAPLGEGFNAAHLIAKLDCDVIVAASNRLGTINHTLLTVQALRTLRSHPSRTTHHAPRTTVKNVQRAAFQGLSVVLMNASAPRHSTPDTRHNPRILAELLAPTPVLEIPFLGPNPVPKQALKNNRKKIKKTLALILGSVKFFPVAHQQHRQKKETSL